MKISWEWILILTFVGCSAKESRLRLNDETTMTIGVFSKSNFEILEECVLESVVIYSPSLKQKKSYFYSRQNSGELKSYYVYENEMLKHEYYFGNSYILNTRNSYCYNEKNDLVRIDTYFYPKKKHSWKTYDHEYDASGKITRTLERDKFRRTVSSTDYIYAGADLIKIIDSSHIHNVRIRQSNFKNGHIVNVTADGKQILRNSFDSLSGRLSISTEFDVSTHYYYKSGKIIEKKQYSDLSGDNNFLTKEQYIYDENDSIIEKRFCYGAYCERTKYFTIVQEE